MIQTRLLQIGLPFDMYHSPISILEEGALGHDARQIDALLSVSSFVLTRRILPKSHHCCMTPYGLTCGGYFPIPFPP